MLESYKVCNCFCPTLLGFVSGLYLRDGDDDASDAGCQSGDSGSDDSSSSGGDSDRGHDAAFECGATTAFECGAATANRTRKRTTILTLRLTLPPTMEVIVKCNVRRESEWQSTK